MSAAAALSPEFESLLGSIGPGRRSAKVTATVARELQPEDLLKAQEAASIQPISLKQIHYSHHQLARLVAQGENLSVISDITGYAPSRISVLKSDPQFQELVAHYAEIEQEEHQRSRADFHERLASLGFDSIELLHQRLLDEPESIATGELLKIMEAAADRTGHGKTQTVNTNNAHFVLDAKDLETIRAAANPSAPNPSAQISRDSLLRLAMRATDANPAGDAPAWIEGEGHELREESQEGAEG